MVRLLASLLVVGLLLGGCQTDIFGRKDPVPAVKAEGDEELPLLPEPGLALAVELRVSDVPLPQGVKEDADRTYLYESSAMKVGRMVYTTRHATSELADFYLRQCPEFDWKLETVTQADGYELLFTKPDKQLEVAIQKRDMFRGCLLVINLLPEGIAK